MIRNKRNGKLLQQPTAVGIAGVDDRLPALGEQPGLGGKVALHIPVVIQMVPGKIGEHGGVKGKPRCPPLRQRLRGDLHDHGGNAVLRHLPQRAVQLHRRRGGIGIGPYMTAPGNAVGADAADPFPGALQQPA